MAKKDKAVATQENAQVARNAYQQLADEVRQAGIEGDLLRFTKQGDWVAGQEETEIEEGTELIMGLNTLKRGWQKWADSKPVDARMGFVSEGFRPCNREELGDLDEDEWEELDGQARDPWQDTMQVLLITPKGDQVYTYATSSKSGKTALGEVSKVYGDRLQDGEDEDAMPVITLQSSFYKHKTYGKIMIPVFELTDKWVLPPVKKEAAAQPKGKAKDKPAVAKPTASRVAPKALPAPSRAANGKGNRARI
jgi:hypothetical protein